MSISSIYLSGITNVCHICSKQESKLSVDDEYEWSLSNCMCFVWFLIIVDRPPLCWVFQRVHFYGKSTLLWVGSMVTIHSSSWESSLRLSMLFPFVLCPVVMIRWGVTCMGSCERSIQEGTWLCFVCCVGWFRSSFVRETTGSVCSSISDVRRVTSRRVITICVCQ